MERRFRVEVAGSLLLAPFLLAVSVGLSLTSSAEADSLNCSQRIVASGDPSYKVRELCGEPDAMEQYVVKRRTRTKESYDCNRSTCYRDKPAVIEVTIDRWTYDFGRRKFMQYLTFEQGCLVRVESGSYGYKN
jgi:hypothetical protein